MDSFRILGLGTALPSHFIHQSEAADFAATCLAGMAQDQSRSATLVQALYRRSGVQTRHSVVLNSSTNCTPATQDFYWSSETSDDIGPTTESRMQRYEQDAPGLAELAVGRALEKSGISPSAVTHLVTVSCSGFSAPGVDLHLIRAHGLSPEVSRTHVGFMGCHGALNGLRVARAFTAADPDAVVIVCAVELCTLHHQYGWNPQEIVANSLFADGAAAVVGCSSANTSLTATISDDANADSIQLIDNFSFVIPDTQDMMTWKIANAGFRMSLSPEVPDVITRCLPAALETFLKRHQLTCPEISSWAIHPGGPRILKACAEVARLTEQQLEPSVSVLAQYGNMSSPTVLFILEELQRRNAGFPCVMMGFGPGLNVEIALLNAGY